MNVDDMIQHVTRMGYDVIFKYESLTYNNETKQYVYCEIDNKNLRLAYPDIKIYKGKGLGATAEFALLDALLRKEVVDE